MYVYSNSVKAIFPAAIPILWVAELISIKFIILSHQDDVQKISVESDNSGWDLFTPEWVHDWGLLCRQYEKEMVWRARCSYLLQYDICGSCAEGKGRGDA